MRLRSRLGVQTILLGCLLSASAALAQSQCPDLAGERPISTAEADQRSHDIGALLRDEAAQQQVWEGVWGGGGVALSFGALTLASLTRSSANRLGDYVGASTALLLPLLMLVSPPRAIRASRELASLDATPAARDACARLRRDEQLLQEVRDDDAFNKSVLAHAAGIGFNVAVGLVLGLGFHHWEGAAMNGLGGIAVTEGLILTRPSASLGYPAPAAPSAATPLVEWRLVPWIGAGSMGAGVAAHF